jgi:hypothetical protein
MFALSSLAHHITSHQAFLIAHQIETDEDVGATEHIEPNDVVRAGEPSLVWFALTKKGGEPIPFFDCDCQLALYQQPHQAGDPPLQQPPLQPFSAEGYTEMPAAEITFPSTGAYELVLTGKPRSSGDFSPFQLYFDVTVAQGSRPSPTPTSQPSPSPIPETNIAPSPAQQVSSPGSEVSVATGGVPIAPIVIGVIGVVLVVLAWQWRSRQSSQPFSQQPDSDSAHESDASPQP